jgi:hypothetical protein
MAAPVAPGGLQARLHAVFGGLLPPAAAPAAPWQPSPQQIFRGGGAADEAGGSSEEEDGAAAAGRDPADMDLVGEEDVPDADGLLGSAAFCRQVDREVELEAEDVLAVRYGDDGRPPPGTELPPDEEDAYDQCAFRMTQALALPPSGSEAGDATAMAVEAAAVVQAAAASPRAAPRGSGLGSPRALPKPVLIKKRSDEGRGRKFAGGKKRVSFTGIPDLTEPWLPPHRRAGAVADAGAGGDAAPSAECVGPAASRPVADYLAHPQNYTRYELEEPLIVGGGVGQLAGEDGGGDMESAALEAQAAARAQRAQPAQDGGEAEPPRWQGAVGGGIEFRPRAQPPAAAAAQAQTSGAPAAAAVARVFQAAWDDEEEAEEWPAPASAVRIAGRQVKGYRSRGDPKCGD